MPDEFVAVLNRSSKEVTGMFDGRRYTWAPHETKTLPYGIAELCKRQNPIMGTEDFNDIRSSEHLLAILPDGDDATAAEQSDAIERYDRDTVPLAANDQVVTLQMKSKGKKNRSAVSDERLRNPGGLQANYDD